MLFTSNLVIDLLGIIVAFVVVFVSYCKWQFRYWSNKGVESLPPSLPFGNIGEIFSGAKRLDDVFYNIHNYLRRKNQPYGGMYFFTQKFFVPLDIELIKNILVKDFNHFVNHGFYVNEEADPLTGNLFSMEDEPWRILRQKISPTFTAGKMKMMFPILSDHAATLNKLIKKRIDQNQPFDIKEVLCCYTTDIIGSCVFGMEFKTMENPNNDFRKYGKRAAEMSPFQLIKNLAVFMFPRNFCKKFNMVLTPTVVTNFFMDLVRGTVEYREKNNVHRKDLMELWIQLKNMGTTSDKDIISDGKIGEIGLTTNQIAAQAFIFYLGGFESSATTMSFALYEMALNMDIQRKVREEIETTLAKHNGELNYEAVMEMKYLDQVFSETLRMYPPFPTILRRCNKDYTIPGTNLTIKEDNFVAISSLGLHYDHEYYPNPRVFNPDRFTEENKATRPNYTWLPFGEGPRICIGMRFGLMQSKVGLISMLRNYEVTINKKTPVPMELKINGIATEPVDGMWLDFKKLEN